MVWECRLGVHTRGVSIDRTNPDSCGYSTLSYHSIIAILRRLNMTSADVFVDVGCGKGRVLCCASRFKVQKVIGVEFRSDLCKIAQENAEKVRGRKSTITVVNMPAEDFDFGLGTVYYLFNPFGASTLKKVLAGMKKSLWEHPRRCRIIYANPVNEALLSQADWLWMYDKWQAGKQFNVEHDITFWQTFSSKR